MKAFWLAALMLFAWDVSPACARPITFSQAGGFVATMDVPDSWAEKKDDSGNLILSNGRHTAVLVFTISASMQSLYDYALDAAKYAGVKSIEKGSAAKISKYRGYNYNYRLNSNNVLISIRSTTLQLGKEHIAFFSFIRRPDISSSEQAEAEKILKGVGISP